MSSAEIGGDPKASSWQSVWRNKNRRLNRRDLLWSSADLDWTNPPAVRGHHEATDQVAAAVVVVIAVRVRIVSAVIGPKAKSSKPTSAKSSSAEPTASEASMEATAAKTASMATATASERHSRLDQADCSKYE
jgi:hypothetical protein